MPDPAVSSPASVVVVPRRMRQLLAILALLVVALMLYAAATLKTSSTGVVRFGTVDQFAIGGLGVLLGAGLLALGCPRVEADAEGIRFRNIGPWHHLPWAGIRTVAFERKSFWASLGLTNGDAIALLAIQVFDGVRAAEGIEGLRALHGAATAAAAAKQPPRPPLLHDD